LKDDIVPLGTTLDKLAAVETYSFVMKDDKNKRREFGVMAQELETIFPELVHTADDEIGTKSVNYVGLIAPIIEASKELKAENNALKEELNTIKKDIAALKNNNTNTSPSQTTINLLFILLGFGMVAVLLRRKKP